MDEDEHLNEALKEFSDFYEKLQDGKDTLLPEFEIILNEELSDKYYSDD